MCGELRNTLFNPMFEWGVYDFERLAHCSLILHLSLRKLCQHHVSVPATRDKEGKNKSLTVEGEDRYEKRRHVTTSPVKRQVTDGDGVQLTKIELELEEAPDNKDLQQNNRLHPILVGPMATELDSTAEVNSSYPRGFPGSPGAVVVRAEEALIIIFVLILWVAAIALFFNRWGKIRMLEPYQPKFQQQHRSSCAVAESTTLPLRTCSKFNIHCLDPTLSSPGQNQRLRQNSVFVGSSMSLLGMDSGLPRRAKSAFDLQSLVLAECTVQNAQDEPVLNEDATMELESEYSPFKMVHSSSNRLLKPFNEFPKPSRSFQRERGASICHFDRTDVLARPLQRERGMSICHFDRMDVLARPLQLRDRRSSICHFDRMDVLARPLYHNRGSRASITSNAEKLENLGRSFQRDSRTNMLLSNWGDKTHHACTENVQRIAASPVAYRDTRLNVSSLERPESIMRILQRENRSSLGNNERGAIVGNLKKSGTSVQSAGNIGTSSREKSSTLCPHDQPSCSKTPDAVHGYEATCV